MPNHVSNIIIANPKVIHAITREHTAAEIAAHDQQHAETKVRYKERTGNEWPYPQEELPKRFVDFELIVPSPPNKEEGGCNSQHEPGVVCWYSWNIGHWGTKWNAYSTEIEPLPGDLCRLTFQTAWSHPIPIIEALSAKFPDEEFEVKYADEDFGSNLDHYRIEDGEYFQVAHDPYELAAEVLYGRPYAEVKAEWDADNIESARSAAFRKRIETERGVENGYEVIRDESLEVPDDIKAAITTTEDAENFWEKENS